MVGHWITTPAEYRLQQRWPVGHDAIDSKIEQSMHLMGVIDGPRMHNHAISVGLIDELGRKERNSTEVRRDLKRLTCNLTDGGAVGTKDKPADLKGARRRTESGFVRS